MVSKECDICHYLYFLDKKFSYQPHLCNGCHDVMQKVMSFLMMLLLSLLKAVITEFISDI